MNSQDIQKYPGFKRLQKLMEDPRYWKQQNPQYVEMIRQGFRDLADTPAQDDEVAHVSTGEVVIPLSAQTPAIMQMLYQTLGEDMIKYTVGSGHEQINPTSGLAAFADDQSWYEETWDDVKGSYRDATKWHFEDRDTLNRPLPKSEEEALQKGFEKYSDGQSRYHQNKRGNREKKYGHQDGREVVFDGDTGQVENDPKYRGTYNYNVPRKMPVNFSNVDAWGEYVEKGAKHTWSDIAPYWIGGNVRGKN